MPDPGIAVADIPPPTGLLAAGGMPATQSQQDQPYRAPTDLRQPLIPSPEKSALTTNDGEESVSARNRANNNPGNMKTSDGGYMSFPTPRAGVEAIGAWLVRAQDQHGLTTVRQLIDDPEHGYAPSADPGNRGKYLPEAAARVLGVDPDRPINMNDQAMRQRMVGAILMQEQGSPEDKANREWGGRLAEEMRSNTAAELKGIEADRARLIAEANKADPMSTERFRMLQEAHDASKRATELYEKQMQTPPVYKPTDIFAGWGGIVMALAALAGRRSAQPLTAALNGMAGAMDGMNSANKEQFDRSFKVWQKQTDYGLALVGVQNQEIRSILEDQRLSDAEKQANLANTYKLFEMDREAAAARRGDTQAQWQHLEQSERLAQQARDHADLVRHWDEDRRQREEKQTPGQIAGKIHDDIIEKWRSDNPDKEPTPEVDAAAWKEAQSSSKTGAGTLEVSKQFDIVDDQGKVVRQVMARERRDGPGFIDSQTGEPLKLDPGQHLKQITPTTSGGGRAGAQVLRQEVGGREVLSDLQNAVNLPVGTTIGPFGTYIPGTSVLGTLQGDLVRRLTDQDSQLMQGSMASMTRELSILMSPVYGGNWAAQQIDPLVPKTGDTLGTVLFKLARLAQSADNALEIVAISPILSNQQQEKASDLRSQIVEAIPWTPRQAMDFAHQGQSSKETFGEFVTKNVTSGSPAFTPGTTRVYQGKTLILKGGDPTDQKNWVEAPPGYEPRPPQ